LRKAPCRTGALAGHVTIPLMGIILHEPQPAPYMKESASLPLPATAAGALCLGPV